MKLRILLIALASIFAASAFASSHDKAGNTNLDKNKISYTIGFDMGKNFKQQDITINPQFIFKGLQDSFTGKKSQFTEEEMAKALLDFQKEIIAKRTTKFKKNADVNKTEGRKFLTTNKGKKGVVALPSGLQYRVIKKGNGKTPTKDDTVTVEYTGKLISGKVFDTTKNSGKPATFKVTRVIPGWTEALQLMKTGANWEIFVPGNLAYGERGTRGAIGPNETLIFNIKLLSVGNTAAKSTAKTNS